MSKSKESAQSTAHALLVADGRLRNAAEAFGMAKTEDTVEDLWVTALAFADAWRACEAGKGRP